MTETNRVSFGLTITPDARILGYLIPEGKLEDDAGTICTGITAPDAAYLPLVGLRVRRVAEEYPYPAIQGYRYIDGIEPYAGAVDPAQPPEPSGPVYVPPAEPDTLPSTFRHPGGVNTMQQVATAAQNLDNGAQPWSAAWSKLLAVADARLSEAPSPTLNYTVPPYYTNPSGHNSAKAILQNDIWAAYSCAAVYAVRAARAGAIPASDKYAAKTVQILNAWATSGTITLDEETSLVTSYACPGFINAAELIWQYPGWSSSARANFRNWCKVQLQPKADFKKLRSLVRTAAGDYVVKPGVSKPYYSNHNCWGILLSLAIAYLTENRAALNEDVRLLKRLIDLLIRSDGGMPEELNRGKYSINYTAFGLESLTAAVELARNAGAENLYHWTAPGGGSLKKGLDFLFDKGIANPSLWPVAGAAAETKLNLGHTPELYSHAGRAYNIAAWRAWADPRCVLSPDIETGVGFPLPLIFR